MTATVLLSIRLFFPIQLQRELVVRKPCLKSVWWQNLIAVDITKEVGSRSQRVMHVTKLATTTEYGQLSGRAALDFFVSTIISYARENILRWPLKTRSPKCSPVLVTGHEFRGGISVPCLAGCREEYEKISIVKPAV